MKALILGTGSAVPDRVLTNQDLEKIVETSDEWILTRTGIRERRIADKGVASSDLGALAASRALESAGVLPTEVDCIITATITPDMLFPATACLIQEKIGAGRIPAFDLSAGCSGFIYALNTARGLIESGIYQKVLVVGADCLSKITDWSDRSTCVLFGDAAGAVLLGPTQDERGILGAYLGADGSGGDTLCMPAGGSRCPHHERESDQDGFIRMQGNDVFRFAVNIMPEASRRVMEDVGIAPEEVDLFIPHQANIRIIESAAKRLGIGPEKVFVNLEKYGNTSAASIPLALDEAVREGRIRQGDLLVLVGFGAGLTWGAAVVRW